eukprot:3606951-Alexandrium_andersonii.AAC.1
MRTTSPPSSPSVDARCAAFSPRHAHFFHSARDAGRSSARAPAATLLPASTALIPATLRAAS